MEGGGGWGRGGRGRGMGGGGCGWLVLDGGRRIKSYLRERCREGGAEFSFLFS